MLAIETSGLTKYYGKARGIIDVDLEVREAEVFGFIGPNGAGKTTTIRSLLSLIRPSRGSAAIFGTPVPSTGGETYRQVGYVPSEVSFYPEMTGAEVLDYAASFFPGGDKAWRRSLAERLSFDPSRPVRSYSHGNRKKLAIIQALLHRPRLLVLDEATSGLDPIIRLELFQLLQELRQDGTTVFFSTHVLEEVERICARVGVIRDGRIIQVSPIDELPGREMRLVTVRLAGGAAPGNVFAGWGRTTEVEGKPGYYQVSVQAPVNQVVSRLAGLDLEYVRIADPTVEDLFLAMYEPGAGSQGGDAHV
ncbi:MAG: ABC transporter ATP-binding protein [Bacillota bacterium]|nr:ABC transporter ATP-binding protein [Bacillota bacterium]